MPKNKNVRQRHTARLNSRLVESDHLRPYKECDKNYLHNVMYTVSQKHLEHF